MAANAALSKNITFWHWYPKLIVEGLAPEQLRWQPEGHDTSIMFALWHAYRSSDELIHRLVMGKPSVFASQGWAPRLPVAETGSTAFGNGLNRQQIGGITLDSGELIAYARAVGASVNDYLASATGEQLAEEVALPFFANVYEGVDRLSRAEAIAFFGIGHVCEHLGEAQMVRGFLGMRGAPL
jgi:hypothetical protein